jgi:hypothetical protein
VRTRIADLLKADDALLKSDDIALRASFYRRFDPKRCPNWVKFNELDGEEFLEAALWNKHIWKSEPDRERLSQICWDHPDPDSSLRMPNLFRAHEDRMRTEHPDWFSNEQAAPLTQDVMNKLGLELINSSGSDNTILIRF